MQRNRNLEKALIALNKWFLENKRNLPFRNDPNPYKVWISEIMLQQTQMSTVIPYFNRFMKEFPDIDSLASSDLSQVFALWTGLGYYNRAKNLHKTSKIISQKNFFPNNRKDLESLPGIGPYTAGAILSIAFHQIEPILDTNVERVLSRTEEVKRDKDYKKNLWEKSLAFIKKTASCKLDPSNINQALMELGFSICKIKNPNCKICPLKFYCLAYKDHLVSFYPSKKIPIPKIELCEETFFILNSQKELLLSNYPNKKWRKHTWDLPFAIEFSKSQKKCLNVQKDFLIKYTITNHHISRKVKIFFIKDLAFLKDLQNYQKFYPFEIIEQKNIASNSSLLKSIHKYHLLSEVENLF